MDMDWEEYFGRRLSELRLQKNVSARRMSAEIGQSDSYINTIENGKSYPTMQTFFYMCEYLKVTPAEFFDADAHDPRREDGVAAKLRGLSTEQLRLISALIDQMKD